MWSISQGVNARRCAAWKVYACLSHFCLLDATTWVNHLVRTKDVEPHASHGHVHIKPKTRELRVVHLPNRKGPNGWGWYKTPGELRSIRSRAAQRLWSRPAHFRAETRLHLGREGIDHGEAPEL